MLCYLQTVTSLLSAVCVSVTFNSKCSSAGKESACNIGDPSLIPGSGRSAGERMGYPLQYSGLENSMDCIVHGVTRVGQGFHIVSQELDIFTFNREGKTTGLHTQFLASVTCQPWLQLSGPVVQCSLSPSVVEECQ